MTPSARNSLPLVMLFAAGCIAVLGYSCVTRISPASAPSIPVAAPALPQPVTPPARADVSPPLPRPAAEVSPESKSTVATPDKVQKWIDAVAGDDRDARAEAIVALATAPRGRAVPVLQKLLISGGEEERQLALKSLRLLAARQGDADGRVRNALREAIYHGDDEALRQNAQVALEDVEREQSARQSP